MAEFKLPTLPPGAKWGFADDPADVPTPEQAQVNLDESVGSILRQVAGPQKPVEQPSFWKNVALPVAEKIPHSPMDIGLLMSSFILGGPAGGAAKMASRFVAPEAGAMLGAAGSTMLRRLLGVGTVGAALGALTGEGAGTGAIEGIAQQLPGEYISKLTQWGRMSAQARDLAKADPEKLGEVILPIIPGLGKLKGPNDFHAAFNNNGAQLVASQAYRQGMDEVAQAVGQQPIRSELMAQMRKAGAQVIPGTMQTGLGRNAAGNIQAMSPMSAEYSFEDAIHTLKRLRKDGWNEEEIRSGLGAMDSREAADQLAKEIKSQIPPELADKFSGTDSMYARAQGLIRYISDPKLLKADGELNVPRLQAKFKAEGYPARQSLQMTADAMALKDAIFRGADSMAEDVAGESGKLFDHFRIHFGIVPTWYPKSPKLGSFAGQTPYGMTPFQGMATGQLLRRGIQGKPVSLAADPEPE